MLNLIGIGRYADQFEEEEYDSASAIMPMPTGELEQLIVGIGMKPGSAIKLRKHVLAGKMAAIGNKPQLLRTYAQVGYHRK